MFEDKIFYSDELDFAKKLLLVQYLKELKVYERLEDNHMYVSFRGRPEDAYFKLFKSSRIYKLIDQTGFSEEEAVEYMVDTFAFYQELRETLYWLNVGSFKKYVPCTGEIKTISGVESVIEDDCVFAKTKEEAKSIFKNIGYSNIMYVIDIDE